ITGLISPVNNTSNPFDCNYNFQYAFTGGCATTTIQNVLGDPNYCNGSSTPIVYTPYPDHYDIWYKFTVSSVMPANAYLHLFPAPVSAAPYLAMGLFGETVPGVPPT